MAVLHRFYCSLFLSLICLVFFQVFSSRDLTEALSKSRDILADTNIAWEKRVDAVSTYDRGFYNLKN